MRSFLEGRAGSFRPPFDVLATIRSLLIPSYNIIIACHHFGIIHMYLYDVRQHPLLTFFRSFLFPCFLLFWPGVSKPPLSPSFHIYTVKFPSVPLGHSGPNALNNSQAGSVSLCREYGGEEETDRPGHV